MRYTCVGNANETTVVRVVRVASMPLADVANFLGMEAEWPPEIMLEGMREHYSEIHLDDVVQVIEHLSPEESSR